MGMDSSRRKEKERKARKARMMKAKEENQEIEKENPSTFNLRPHRLRPHRTIIINNNSNNNNHHNHNHNHNNNHNKKNNKNNKLTTLQQHQAQGMVQHVWMFWQPPMKSKSRKDALAKEDKTNVMKWHGRTEKEPRDFLYWLEILMHFVQVYDVDQHQCPEKLVYKTVRKPLAKGTSLFMRGYSEKTETPSHSECSEDRGIRWAEKCFFISYHTTCSSMWEWTSFSYREFSTTNCMYPWPWMHKSYGLSKGSWSFLQGGSSSSSAWAWRPKNRWVYTSEGEDNTRWFCSVQLFVSSFLFAQNGIYSCWKGIIPLLCTEFRLFSDDKKIYIYSCT